VIRSVVLMYVRFPLSLRNVEENHERHFIDRQTYKQRHSAAPAERQGARQLTRRLRRSECIV
jgi:transposase-like protein